MGPAQASGVTGSAIDAGAAARGGMTGGEDASLAGGAGGVSGGAPDGAIMSPDQVPGPGEAYGPCRDDDSCDAQLFCAFDATSGSVERYCTALCDGTGLVLSCPPHPSGRPAFCLANVCAR